MEEAYPARLTVLGTSYQCRKNEVISTLPFCENDGYSFCTHSNSLYTLYSRDPACVLFTQLAIDDFFPTFWR